MYEILEMAEVRHRTNLEANRDHVGRRVNGESMDMYLLPEGVARQDGSGRVIALDAARGKPLLLRLGITRIMEQESLDISLWGSADKLTWKLLQVFPPKFYCGNYSLPLNLARYPDVRYLRADWKMSRWLRNDEPAPLFGFYLLVEEAQMQGVGA